MLCDGSSIHLNNDGYIFNVNDCVGIIAGIGVLFKLISDMGTPPIIKEGNNYLVEYAELKTSIPCGYDKMCGVWCMLYVNVLVNVNDELESCVCIYFVMGLVCM